MSFPLSESFPALPRRSEQDVRDYLVVELSKSLEVAATQIDPAASLHELGVDSLTAIGMAGGLATWLGRDVPATLMWDYRSINAIALALASVDVPRALPEGIVVLQPHGTATPLFGFPGLAGTPLAFAAMASKLGEDQPFYGVAVPGFENVPGSYSTVEEIAAAMLTMIRQVQPTGPYQFAGYCFGGLLAYEAARQLAAGGEQVSLLAIYDAFTPEGRSPLPAWRRGLVHLRLLASDASHWTEIAGKLRLSHLSRKMRKPQTPYWIEPAGDELSAGTVLWKTNALAASKYRPAGYAGPILWFQAADRSKHNAFYRMMPCGGWSRCTSAGVQTVTIPGDHGNLIGPDHATTAASALRPFLPGFTT